MNCHSLRSWEDLELEHLFYAFRKAKADAYFEHTMCASRRFAEYESELPSRLAALLERLKAGQIDAALIDNLGDLRIVAKKLGLEAKSSRSEKNNGHGFFSDPERAFDRLCRTHKLTPEFRVVGDFPVDMHVMSALWVNFVGHKFDAKLERNSYGSRLRRYRPAPDAPTGTVGDYHIEGIGSFQPYFSPYKTWRELGLNAIRGELEADRKVIAVSMDLTSYYHRVDPSFLADEAFQRQVGVDLSDWERSFTRAFAQALVEWSNRVAAMLATLGCKDEKAQIGGLPIGLSMVRIAANALLADFDRDITQGLVPVYYGRYVDDIFLVLRDPENLSSAEDLLQFIAARTHYFPPKALPSGEIRLKPPGSYWGKTSLTLQKSKQKVFFLEGRSGLDLLDSIESQIRSVSSERRLMPAPDNLEKMASAQVLTAAANAAEEADTLRRADGLSVRRLGWSIQLRAVETLARDLRASDWQAQREKFYEFAHNHVLRPDKILEHIDYLPRLLSLAVALMDWPHARRLVDGAIAAIKRLEQRTESGKVKLNGFDTDGATPEVWAQLRASINESAADAIARSLRWSRSGGGMLPLPDTATRLCELIGLGADMEEVKHLSLLLRESDWAKTPYKDHIRRNALRQRPAIENEALLHGLYTHEKDLREFLNFSTKSDAVLAASRVGPNCVPQEGREIPSLLPYLLPTRPYTTQEVSLYLPGMCIFGDNDQQTARNWARYVRAVRGVWVWASLVDFERQQPTDSSSAELPIDDEIAYIGSSIEGVRPRLGISSLLTTDHSFREGAAGKSDISPSRYQRVKTIVDQAIQARPKPTHLLLPELALPERWIDTVSSRLRDAGISLIAGLDYHVNGAQIHSEAVLVLTDDRLGFPSTVQIRQPKSLPAAGEEETLLKVFGKTWQPTLAGRSKPVYVHQGLCFGVLVCSELQNIGHRQRFQGNVDCVTVLSWNQDLETFAALVESGSLDVHAHIALVNNRRYGDSRVRSPAKLQHARDVCRLRGGDNEHVVVVELDIEGLRSFQSRDRRWPTEDDPYKPTPEGFVLAPYRRVVPR
jgi:hypothetical protein